MGKIEPERHYKSFWAQNSHITGVAGGYWRKDILLKMGLTWETHAGIFGNLSIFFFRTTFEGCQDFLRFHSKDKDFTQNKCNRQWIESITTKGRYHILKHTTQVEIDVIHVRINKQKSYEKLTDYWLVLNIIFCFFPFITPIRIVALFFWWRISPT